MPSFNPSTQEMVGYINGGLRAQTAVVDNATYILATAVDIFTVYGRIRIISLDYEAVTACSDTATLLKWQFNASVPAIAAHDISGAALTCATIAQGRRIVFQGTALDTAQVISTNPCTSLSAPTTMDVGCYAGVGTLATHGAVATTSGTGIFTLCYIPLTDGAYAEPLC